MSHIKKIIAATAVTGALVFGGAVAANAATTTTAKAPAATATAKAPATGTAKANCPNM